MPPVNPLGSNPFLSPTGEKKRYVVDAESREGLSDYLSDTAGGPLSSLLWALDTPGAFARGTLAGGLGRGLSEAFASEDDRTSGRELLREQGLVGDEDNWANWAAGVGAEIATDPLSYATGAVRALGTAGRAADAAGLLKSAPQTLSRFPELR